MKVSVAMTTYNGERFLEEQLKSIVAQTMLPDELVICDDSSSDGTLDILNRFKSTAPFEVHVRMNEENLGYVKNFEQAISHCTGDVIVLSDQDDIWRPDRIFTTVKLLKENPLCGYVFSDATLIDDNNHVLGELLWEGVGFTLDRQQQFMDPEMQLSVLYPRHCVTGATLAFRSVYRDLVLPIPISDAIIHDGWIALMLSLHGHYGIAFNEPLISYRLHSNQEIGLQAKKPINKIRLFLTSWEKGLPAKIDILLSLKSLISTTGTEEPMQRFEKAYGELLKSYGFRSEVRKISSRLRRISPILKEYLQGGYDPNPFPFLSAVKDFIV